MNKSFKISIPILVILIISLFGYQNIPIEQLKKKYAKSPSAFVKIDGMNVHYRDEGEKNDSIPIVLIHGTDKSSYLQLLDQRPDNKSQSN